MRRRLTIEIYKGRGKQPWRWRLLSRNWRIVADSAEGYVSRANVVRAAKRLRAEILHCPLRSDWSGTDIMDKDPTIGCWRKIA